MDVPHPATVWTARICAALWLIALCVAARTGNERASHLTWRFFWCLAGLTLAIHTIVAFTLEHGWSHSNAYIHTAKRTNETIGIDWGGGLFFNYAVLGIWMTDCGLLILRFSLANHQKWRSSIDWFVAFMMLNATIVFGPRGWILIGVVGAVVLSMVRQNGEPRSEQLPNEYS